MHIYIFFLLRIFLGNFSDLFFFLEHFTVCYVLYGRLQWRRSYSIGKHIFFMTTFKCFVRLCMDTAANIHELNESHREQN